MSWSSKVSRVVADSVEYRTGSKRTLDHAIDDNFESVLDLDQSWTMAVSAYDGDGEPDDPEEPHDRPEAGTPRKAKKMWHGLVQSMFHTGTTRKHHVGHALSVSRPRADPYNRLAPAIPGGCRFSAIARVPANVL